MNLKHTTGYTLGITPQQMQVLCMRRDGKSLDDIVKICFNVLAEDGVHKDEEKVKKAKAQIRKWYRDPKINEAFRSLLQEKLMEFYGPAVAKIGEQIGSDKPWVANKAANDIIRECNTLMAREAGNEMVVKVEGMPVIGVPDE